MKANSKRPMKKNELLAGWLLLLAFSMLTSQPSSTLAQSTGFSYQGVLTYGANPANGSYDFRFVLTDAVTGGNQIAGPFAVNGAVVSNGLFLVAVDFGGVFTGTNYWLDVGVRTNGSGNFISLTPRQPITPSPYAVYAPTAGTITGTVRAGQIAGLLADSQLSANIPRLNGNPVFTGAALFSSATGSFAGSGAGLTNLNLSGAGLTGTLGDGHLSTNVALLNAAQAFSGTFMFRGMVTATNYANSFAGKFSGDGSALTNLSAGGSSTNAALLNANQTFTGQNLFQGMVTSMNPANTFAGKYYGDGAGLTNVNAASAWKLTGNSGTTAGSDFLGTTDTQPLELRVNGARTLRLEPGITAPNVIAGDSGNSVAAGTSGGAIGGGGTATSPNTVAADFSTVSGGWSNSIAASASGSVIGGGWINIVQTGSSNAVIAGGAGNSIQTAAIYGTVGGGATNQIVASAQYATIPGGHGASVDKYGQFSLASGVFNTPGDAQTSVYVLRGTSSSAALSEVYLDGLTRRLTVPLNSAWIFRILLIGHGLSSATSHGFEIAGLIVNNNGTPALFGGTNTLSFGDAGFASSVTAATGPVALVIEGQRTPSTEVVRWVATVYTSEVRW